MDISQTLTAILGLTTPRLGTGPTGSERGGPNLALPNNLCRASPRGSTLPLEAKMMSPSSVTSLIAEKKNESINPASTKSSLLPIFHHRSSLWLIITCCNIEFFSNHILSNFLQGTTLNFLKVFTRYDFVYCRNVYKIKVHIKKCNV